MGNNRSHFENAKLQPNEHGLYVRTVDLNKHVKALRKAGYKIEAISWPTNENHITIWYYWTGRSRPTHKLPDGSFIATLGWGEKILRVPKKEQKRIIQTLEAGGNRILAVDYDDKGIGRIWFQ